MLNAPEDKLIFEAYMRNRFSVPESDNEPDKTEADRLRIVFDTITKNLLRVLKMLPSKPNVINARSISPDETTAVFEYYLSNGMPDNEVELLHNSFVQLFGSSSNVSILQKVTPDGKPYLVAQISK